MHACATYGSEYVASIVATDAPIAAFASVASPSTVYSVPGPFVPPATYGVAEPSSACASVASCVLLSEATLTGSVQLTVIRFAACHVSHVFGPTTATALTLPATSI